MRRISPATVISLVALFIALQGNGFAGIGGKGRATIDVLASPITVAKDLPARTPSGYVMCPRGYRAFGGGSDSWGGFDAYTNVLNVPAFYNAALGRPETFRDSGEGPQWPADGWFIGGIHHAEAGNQPLKAIVTCAKVIRITR